MSFSFVLQNGASFRFDPPATFLVMLSVALILREKLRWLDMAAAGLAVAIATMVSIKAVLALPLVVAIGLCRLVESADRRQAFLRLGLAGASSILFLFLLYAWHVSTLAPASAAEAQAHLSESYRATLAETPFFPRLGYFLRSTVENPVHWLALLLGISAVAANGRRNGRTRTLLLLSFLLPLGALLFYRNAFPYFYAFMLAPAAVLFAAAASRPELERHVWAPALVMGGAALFHHQGSLSAANVSQRQAVEAVHAMFPQPVPYLDRCSMIGSFPQSGIFLSTWWIENYLAAGRPLVRDLLVRTQPVFVIANSPVLAAALEARSPAPGDGRLLDADGTVLRSNYVHHWGPIWVAGKTLHAGPAPAPTEFLIAGNYRFEGRAPLLIDGRAVAPGNVARLGRGVHAIASPSGRQNVVLRWAVDRPDGRAPRQLGFGRF